MRRFITITIVLMLVFAMYGCNDNSIEYTEPKDLEGVWKCSDAVVYENSESKKNISFELEIAGNEMRIVEACVHTTIYFDNEIEYRSEYLHWLYNGDYDYYDIPTFVEWMYDNHPEVKPVENTETLKGIVWHGSYGSITDFYGNYKWTSETLDINNDETINYIFGYSTDFSTADFIYKDGHIVYEYCENGIIHEFIFER